MSNAKNDTGTSSSPEVYLDDVRYRVTRYFCILCFVLALLAVPSSLLAKDVHTQIINCGAVFFYLIPLQMVLGRKNYRITAKVFITIAIVVTLANAVSANCDFSPATVVWYFVYLVFAHLVLNLKWAMGIAAVGSFSVTLFAMLHLTGHNRINTDLMEDSVIVGAPVTLLVSFVSLLYLLTVYKRLWSEMFGRVVESNREKSQLVGVMSHDMRNYLGAVQGICTLIQDDLENSPEPTRKELLNNVSLIDQASTGALHLVEEVVALTRDSIDQKLYMEELDLLAFIAPIFQRYQVLGRSKGIKFIIAAESCPALVAINRDKFSRVIENLLSNALKFTRQGDTVSIVTRCAGRTVTLEVSDTGIGIPAELRGRVFDQFTKAGRSGTANEKSIGLGLSIVKRLVELHGGTIRLNSDAGVGTAFLITLEARSQKLPGADAENSDTMPQA